MYMYVYVRLCAIYENGYTHRRSSMVCFGPRAQPPTLETPVVADKPEETPQEPRITALLIRLIWVTLW